MSVPAPRLLTTCTGCPSASARNGDIVRVMRSALPPTPNATTIVTGLAGNSLVLIAIGSSPVCRMVSATSADDRNARSRAAPAALAAPVVTPAAKVVIFWNSPGMGPAYVAPLIGRISLICWKPISTSPRATTAATRSLTTRRLFGASSSHSARRGNRSFER